MFNRCFTDSRKTLIVNGLVCFFFIFICESVKNRKKMGSSESGGGAVLSKMNF